jgi:hypothetical protein
MTQWADSLKDLGQVLDVPTYTSETAPALVKLGTVNDKLVGVFIKTAVKGLIWYSPKTIDIASGSTKTWDDLKALAAANKTKADATWCMGVESGAASGWPGTDWIEDIVLRQAGADVYDQWVKNEIPFTDPQIAGAFDTLGEILLNPEYVNAGIGDVVSINSTPFGADIATAVVDGTCPMTHQASFFDGFLTDAGGNVAEDGDVWAFITPGEEAGASAVLDSGDPAVRGLQGAIDRARVRALDGAARAADNTLAAFAQTCHTALVDEKPERTGAGSYARLAEHCRELHLQWQETPLRPRLPALEGRMAQYGVYETVCGVKTHTPDDLAGIFFNAEQLHQAATLSRRAFEGAHDALDDRLRAFRKHCTGERSTLLKEVIKEEADAARATYNDLSVRLQQALQKSAEVAAACDTLLIGNPLAQARGPGSPADLAQGPQAALPKADRSLIDDARRAAGAAREQREQPIELPAHDVPQQALRTQQGGLAVLQQMELTAETAADVLTCFNLLFETLGTTPPEAQPALVDAHADAMEQRALMLQKAVRDHYTTSDAVSDSELFGLMEDSQAMLRADQRLARRMHMSLRTLADLLDEREFAQELLGELEQKRQPALELADRPEFTGAAHSAISKVLAEGMKSVEQDLLEERSKIPREAWKVEQCRHNITAAAMDVKIRNEGALIQAQLLLALPDHRPEHRKMVADVFEKLTRLSKTLKELGTTSEHGDRYLEQYDVNEKVRRKLVELKLKLASLDTAPTGTAAAGSSGADEPAARPSGATPAPAETSKGDKSSRRRRQARRR